MRNLITDNGVDLLLEVLQETRSIRLLMQQKNNINSNENVNQKIKEVSDYNKKGPVKALIRPNTDGFLMLSRKGQYQNKRQRDEYYKDIKNSLNEVLNRMTTQDYMKLSEAGFEVEDLSIEALSSAVDLIKGFSGSGQDGIKSSEQRKNNTLTENEIKSRMEAENLPASNELLERVSNALQLSEDITLIDKKDILYLLQNELSPTIENIYKARYSSQNSDTSNKLSDEEWKELTPQVREILNQIDAGTSKENIENARWLIENKLPLTKENLKQINDLEKLRENYDKDVILNKILSGMREGLYPEEAVVIEDDRVIFREDNLSKEEMLKRITAKRQLEEIRLTMTREAASNLEKKGFDIDTQALLKIVEELRLEEEYYKELYRQENIIPKEEDVELLRTTTESVQQLKSMPINLIGSTLNKRRFQTITSLLESGNNIISELDKAKEAYEALYTQPRRDYGDSIQKAFNNMGSLMAEMGIEDTEYNRRAIRILGYNQMDISKESIGKVKAYDLSLSHLIENLHPKVAVQIIKEGDSPLNMPIDELNQRIDVIKEEQGNPSLEKYSSYLYKSEKEGGISESERKAYIGIYRLLYQIDKSDGAALGAVIKSDVDVTLNHLLTALRTTRLGQVDHKVDDNYGLLEEVLFDKETISEQLGAAFDSTTYADMTVEQSVEGEIQSNVIKQLLDNLTPDKLYQIHQNIAEKSPSTVDVWDTLGRMPIEQLLEQLKNTQEAPGKNQVYYHEKMTELREIYGNSDQAIHFLNDFNMPCTTTNLLMAGQILNNGGTVFKKLYKNTLKEKLELSDRLIDEETMNEAYEELDREVKTIIDKESSSSHMDSIKLNQLNSLGKQIKFIKNLAKRRFYQIPLETAGKLTNINLTIIKDQASASKVTITYESDKLGYIKAEATLNEDKLSGYFSSNHIEGLKRLKTQEIQLREALQEESVSIKQLNFYLQQSSEGMHAVKNMYTYKNSDVVSEENDKSAEPILYRVARAMVLVIRSAEEVKEVA